MKDYRLPLLDRYVRNIPAIAGLTVCLIGAFVLVGWAFEIPFLKSLLPSLVSMKPNTAVSFLLSGFSLILLGQWVNQNRWKSISRLSPILALIIIGISLLTIAQYLLHRNLGIDQLLFREQPGAVETLNPGRMSPLAAGGLILTGITHLLAYRFRIWGSQFFSLGIIFLGIATLFGYGFEVEAIYGPGPYTSVALHSAVTFIILGAGTISIFPNQSVIKTLYQKDVGGFVARRFLPATLILPFFIGLILLAGQRIGLYGVNVTTLLITLATVVIFTVVIFINARLLSAIEYERSEIEQAGRLEVESAQQRLTFLAKASRILARTLEYELTLDRIARLSVPFISDWCTIDMVQENGELKRVAVKHVDISKKNIVEELEERYPADPISRRGVLAVINSGKSELFPEISEALLQEVLQDQEQLRLIQALGIHSVMIVPLKSREEIYGAITFATAESGRQFNENDLELAEELGRRAATAVENAKLFQETKIQNEVLEDRVRQRTYELEAANLELRTEIEERKRIETELRDSEKTLASLVRTAEKLITLVDVDIAYKIICEETARALDVPICNIRLIDRHKSKLVYASGIGLPDTFWERVVSPPAQYEELLSGERGHQTSILLDVQTLKDSPNLELFKEFDIRTSVGVSLVRDNEPIGRLTVATTGETREFSENDLVLLKGLADQAALAIQNAQLLNQVQKGRERLRWLTRQLVSAQENERRRISKELHDEAGQSLTAMKINLDMIRNVLPESSADLKEQLADLSALADEIMERLRMLAYDLRPPALETLGLNKTLEGLCRQFADRTDLSIKYEGTELPSLPGEAAITIYRLVQEALTNVAKHAGANRVDVKLEEGNSQIVATVKDDGVGFTADEVDRNKLSFAGMGLSGMRERLESVGGQLEIHSKPGDGAEIIGIIPNKRTEPHPQPS